MTFNIIKDIMGYTRTSPRSKGVYMATQTRRENIEKLVNERGFASVAELAELFQVSDMTIRRDLDRLEGQTRPPAHIWRGGSPDFTETN